MFKLLKDFIQMEWAIKEMQKAFPPTYKIVISSEMIPWLEIITDCVSSNAKPEDVRKALYQCALLDDRYYLPSTKAINHEL